MQLPLFVGFTIGLSLFMLLGRRQCQVKLDKQLRAHLNERQLDKMIEDSFPASDPPSTY